MSPASYRMKFVWSEDEVFPDDAEWAEGLDGFTGFQDQIPDRVPSVALSAGDLEPARLEAADRWPKHKMGVPLKGGPRGFAIVDREGRVVHYWFVGGLIAPEADLSKRFHKRH